MSNASNANIEINDSNNYVHIIDILNPNKILDNSNNSHSHIDNSDSDGDSDNSKTLECPICFHTINDDEGILILNCCKNKIHLLCLIKWYSNTTDKHLCFLCKQTNTVYNDFIDDNLIDNNNDINNDINNDNNSNNNDNISSDQNSTLSIYRYRYPHQIVQLDNPIVVFMYCFLIIFISVCGIIILIIVNLRL